MRPSLGTFELTVMLVLMRLGDHAYGVPISKELEDQTGREVALGSVYAALERLEQKGFVSSSTLAARINRSPAISSRSTGTDVPAPGTGGKW